MQRYQPEYYSLFNIRKSSSIKNTFNNLICKSNKTVKATIIGLFFLCQFIVNSAAPIPRTRYNNYPAVDLSVGFYLKFPETLKFKTLLKSEACFKKFKLFFRHLKHASE